MRWVSRDAQGREGRRALLRGGVSQYSNPRLGCAPVSVPTAHSPRWGECWAHPGTGLAPFPLETDFLPFPEQPLTTVPLLPGCCNKTTCPPVKEGIVSTWATPSRVGRAEPAEKKPSLPGGGISVPGLNQAAGVAAIKETTPRAPQTETQHCCFPQGVITAGKALLRPHPPLGDKMFTRGKHIKRLRFVFL